MADFHAHSVGQTFCAGFCADGEADDDGFRGTGQKHVRFRHSAACGMQNSYLCVFFNQSLQRLFDGFHAALDVGL